MTPAEMIEQRITYVWSDGDMGSIEEKVCNLQKIVAELLELMRVKGDLSEAEIHEMLPNAFLGKIGE